MTRGITSSLKTAAESNVLRPVFLFDFAFDAATLRLFSGVGTITWGGNIYTGAGNLLSVDTAEETSDIEARNATFSLSAIPSSILSIALSTDYQGRPVRVYLGAFDASGVLIADPVQIYGGQMDVMSIDDTPASPTISLSTESDLVILRRSSGRRYTPKDLQIDYPGDTGLDFITSTQDQNLVWGR